MKPWLSKLPKDLPSMLKSRLPKAGTHILEVIMHETQFMRKETVYEVTIAPNDGRHRKNMPCIFVGNALPTSWSGWKIKSSDDF